MALGNVCVHANEMSQNHIWQENFMVALPWRRYGMNRYHVTCPRTSVKQRRVCVAVRLNSP